MTELPLRSSQLCDHPSPTQDLGVSLDVQYLLRELQEKQSGNLQSDRWVPEVTRPQSRQEGWTRQPEDWPEGPRGVWRPTGLWSLPLHTPPPGALVHGALVHRACAHTITESDRSAGLMPRTRAHAVTGLPSEPTCMFLPSESLPSGLWWIQRVKRSGGKMQGGTGLSRGYLESAPPSLRPLPSSSSSSPRGPEDEPMAGLPNVSPHLLHLPSRPGWRQGPGAGPGRPALPSHGPRHTGCLCPLVSPFHPEAPKFRSVGNPHPVPGHRDSPVPTESCMEHSWAVFAETQRKGPHFVEENKDWEPLDPTRPKPICVWATCRPHRGPPACPLSEVADTVEAQGRARTSAHPVPPPFPVSPAFPSCPFRAPAWLQAAQDGRAGLSLHELLSARGSLVGQEGGLD